VSSRETHLDRLHSRRPDGSRQTARARLERGRRRTASNSNFARRGRTRYTSTTAGRGGDGSRRQARLDARRDYGSERLEEGNRAPRRVSRPIGSFLRCDSDRSGVGRSERVCCRVSCGSPRGQVIRESSISERPEGVVQPACEPTNPVWRENRTNDDAHRIEGCVFSQYSQNKATCLEIKCHNTGRLCLEHCRTVGYILISGFIRELPNNSSELC